MGENQMLRQLLPLLHTTCAGSSEIAKGVLGWIEEQRGHFWPHLPEGRKLWKKGWKALPRLATELGADNAEPALLGTADAVARLLALAPFDAALLRTAVALQRLPRLAALRRRLAQAGADIPVVAGLLAGAEPGTAAASVRRSLPIALGLIEIEISRSGQVDLETSWRFDRLLDRGITDEDQLTEALAGIRQAPSLPAEAFADQRAALGFLRRLLAGALAAKAEGVNILIHGPPGTGKTEFARTLAGAANACLYAVGEADEDGEEPTRFDRLHALKRAHRLLARRSDSVLLFDEMEDLLAAPSTSASQNRTGSKLFVNRLLEANPVPTIWTSNSLDEVDPAHMRRMSYVLAMKHPSARSRARIVARIAAEAAMPYAAVELQPLVAAEAASGSVARAAIRSAKLAGGEAEDVPIVAHSLLRACVAAANWRPVARTRRSTSACSRAIPPSRTWSPRLPLPALRPMSRCCSPVRPARARPRLQRISPTGSIARCSSSARRTCSPSGSAAPRRTSPPPSPKRARTAPCCCSTKRTLYCSTARMHGTAGSGRR
jgi:hypothetical protein